jgi:PAS domain-containing protein
VIGIDVTENIELQERYNLHSLLLNGTGDLAVATDMENRLIYMNEAAEIFFDTNLKAEQGRRTGEINSRTLRSFLEIAVSQSFDSNEKRIVLPRSDDSHLSIEFTSKIVRDSNKEVGIIFLGRRLS